MITHPQFDPVLISIGPLAVRWYALSYILGFIFLPFSAEGASRKACPFLPKNRSTTS